MLINPYIYDFSAYSFWSAPLGLLYLGGILRANGFEVGLVDCLKVVEEKRKEDGRAPFIKEEVEKPRLLKNVRKRYRRYGISKEDLAGQLSAQEPPDLILITSIMTYWYQGTKEVLDIARDLFPTAKIAVGGIYPSLCYEHALFHMNKADLVVRNREVERFYRFVEDAFSFVLPHKPSIYDMENVPYPCFDLYQHIPFVPLVTSYGCAYRCSYCATSYMHPNIVRRNWGSVLAEIRHWQRYGVNRFVIYDDNFLFHGDRYAKPLLRAIADLPFPVSIYNPNAINAALVDQELAHLLLRAGFREVRIGLETLDRNLQKSTGGKVDTGTFEGALQTMVRAGFSMDTVGAYILAGLPFQRWEDVKHAIDYLLGLGVTPHIAEYTPIPHTRLFQEYGDLARYAIAEDPIYQNNALFPFAWEGFTENDLAFLKRYVRDKRLSVANPT
jgi:radical SAM superfamily enzyme YgiQ (UPF0313 family)